jgi:ribosome biogenesis GTPase A
MNSRTPNTCHSRLVSILLLTMFVLQLQILRTTAARSFSSTAAFATTSPLFSSKKNSLRRPLSSTAQDHEAELLESGYQRPMVQWYPGHIAKAERQLSETLKAVDVVVEVRDARACKATAHPRVGEWCAGRPRIVVLTHLDMTPKQAVRAWQKAYDVLGAERWDEAPVNAQVANQAKQARNIRFQSITGSAQQQQYQREKIKKEASSTLVTPVEQVLFVNARQGQGIHMLTRAIFKAGAHVQERRERRGLNPRALRVGVIGYPNVGKVCRIERDLIVLLLPGDF